MTLCRLIPQFLWISSLCLGVQVRVRKNTVIYGYFSKILKIFENLPKFLEFSKIFQDVYIFFFIFVFNFLEFSRVF